MKANCWERITILNTHFGITMSELEKRAVLARGTLPRKKPDDYYPRMETLDKICNVYGITISEFFMDKYNFTELDLAVQKNELLRLFGQLTKEEQKIMLNIIEERDPLKFHEKCYAVIQVYDTEHRYESFEDYLKQKGLAEKLLKN